ncbi:MAG TPA: SPOR domain-containing protein [Vicinamibacterales bacterium]
MASHTQDDGFHEIQLNGKQLVFLFMAATVVSVVIFLCGVLVGRGVRAERGTDVESAELSPADPAPQPAAASTAPTPAGSDPTAAAAAPQAVDDLSYFNRLEGSNPPPEQLKAAAPPAAPPATKPAAAQRATPPAAPKEPAPTAQSTDAQGTGYAVQIAALNIRSEADAIAKRLAAKGYAAYVMNPAAGTPQIYRVRIGKFGSRREAETIATKLEKEEQFKPWVTR